MPRGDAAHRWRVWSLWGLVATMASGCFWRAQGGYVQPMPFSGPGGGLVEVSGGLGDLRSKPSSVAPEHLSVDAVAHTSAVGQRLGLGVSAAWVPLAGWAHDWSPHVRVGLRALQVEWLTSTPPAGGLSGVLEAGAVFFTGHGTRGRAFFSLVLAGEGLVRYGLTLPPGFLLSVLLGVGFGTSIGPSS
ncbi:MAG: hypothetical protein SFW67_33670 [Myxococcaceae bacterium]|nr:hypothetical protein [Myxococcaceae bacterium]